MTRLPQVLVNVPGVDKAARRRGRRRWPPRSPRPRPSSATPAGCCCGPSGTEPLVRVMVEAATAEQAEAVADRLADVVRDRLAL